MAVVVVVAVLEEVAAVVLAVVVVVAVLEEEVVEVAAVVVVVVAHLAFITHLAGHPLRPFRGGCLEASHSVAPNNNEPQTTISKTW